MSPRVTILPDRAVREVTATTVADLLRQLGLSEAAHLVVRGEDILTRDVRLKGDEEVEIWPVISGGDGGADEDQIRHSGHTSKQ